MPQATQCDEKKIIICTICGQIRCCLPQGSAAPAGSWASPKLADAGPIACRIFPGLGATLIGPPARTTGRRENGRQSVTIPSLLQKDRRFDRAPLPHLKRA
jgi:hypothetical protein